MGGMTALAFAMLYANRARQLVTISSAARSLPFSIAIRSLQRELIRRDPEWRNGEYPLDVHTSVWAMTGMEISPESVMIMPGGKPTMQLTGGAALRLSAMMPAGHQPVIHLTITDDMPLALARAHPLLGQPAAAQVARIHAQPPRPAAGEDVQVDPLHALLMEALVMTP